MQRTTIFIAILALLFLEGCARTPDVFQKNTECINIKDKIISNVQVTLDSRYGRRTTDSQLIFYSPSKDTCIFAAQFVNWKDKSWGVIFNGLTGELINSDEVGRVGFQSMIDELKK